MKPKSISYSESKESFDITTGLKSWRKAGVEIELDRDGYDDVKQAFGEAKNLVWDALANLNVTEEVNHFMNGITPSPTILPTIDYSSKERTEQAIQDCKTPHELDLLMGDIAKHQLVPQYLEKKKSLK